MRIELEELPHQSQAIDAIKNSFSGLQKLSTPTFFSNPEIKFSGEEKANIDIKMETGTGKTYVGVRSIYELFEKYKIFKFIIVVPTPAIKEGWKSFIESDYAKQHFSNDFENIKINLTTINSGDFRSKRGFLPAHLTEFIESDNMDSSTIQVLLINSSMLISENMKGVITRGKRKGQDRFNQILLNEYTKPIEAISATRPIVIIDEPHRFPPKGEFYKGILNIKPQMILRLGATFPFTPSEKNPVADNKYFNGKPDFELNAIDSFNLGLVKGIDIYYPNLTSEQAKSRYKVDNVKNKELVLKKGNNKWNIKIGESLANIDSLFEGNLTYIGNKKLSNDLEISEDMELVPSTFTNSYQEFIIRDAINQHFEHEINNFLRENSKDNFQPKVKTLSLFFIDSITSYRNHDGWLKLTFEKLLKQKIIELISEFKHKKLPRELEYLDFLKATYASLVSDKQEVHAGYFGEDRGTGEEAIQAEVSDILKSKEKLLSFKDSEGQWITRRFLFSKWTLREGWDNPNVFVIAKLRTSGSENNKIQEVGRGLRLPVDETGHRLKQEEFPSRLSYLIGYDEKNFAEKLIGDINSDIRIKLDEKKLTNEMIEKIVENKKQYKSSYDEVELLEELDELNIINRNNEFNSYVEINKRTMDGFEWMIELYPELNISALKKDKVRDMKNNPPNLKVKLNSKNWNELIELWKELSVRYMLEFEKLGEKQLEEFVMELLNDEEIFVKQIPERVQQKVKKGKDGYQFVEESTGEYNFKKEYIYMKYGEFLKTLVLKTKVPISIMHKLLLTVLKNKYDNDERYLSENSLDNIIKEFNRRFEAKYSQRYIYRKLDFSATTTVYDSSRLKFREYVDANYLGINVENNVQPEKRFLYERPPVRYDSVQPELELLKRDYGDHVIVFGNLPKKAIKVPKYTGGTTTPDFVYMIKNNNNKAKYLIVETKAENMRLGDKTISEIQNGFFNMLDDLNVKYQLATSAQEVYDEIRRLKELE